MASDSTGKEEGGQNVPGPSKLKQRTKSEGHHNKPKKTVYFPSKTAFEKLAYAPRKKYDSSEDYFTELRQWLHQVFFWQSVSSAFPYFLMCQQLGQAPPVSPPTTVPESSAGAETTDQTAPSASQQSSSGNSNQAGVEQAPGVNQVNFQQFPFPPSFNFGPPVPFQQFPYPYPPQFVRPQTQQHPRREPVQDGIEVRIPAFWKRIIAEFIDFLILFFVKIVVTYFAVDFFNIIDLDNFDVFQKDMKIAYKTFIQITQDIVILELIHRVVVCAFETYWLSGGQNGRTGGSTPGKSIMGLRVVRCDSSVTVGAAGAPAGDGGGGELVVVRPGTNLGLGVSFIRAAIKNLVLALLIPTSFAFIFFPHNRTGYDMICNTIVVEEPIIPHHQHQD